MSYHVKTWFGPMPGEVDYPAIRSIAEKWFQIRAEREPCLADFWHDADETFLANAILLIKHDNDYTYVHQGRVVQKQLGFSMQGLRMSQLRTKVRDTLFDIYNTSVERFLPCYFQFFADFHQNAVLWGRLCIPLRLAQNDPGTAILLYCHSIEDKSSMYKSVFENSDMGIMIAAPFRNEHGEIVNAMIVAQNERAGCMTGVHDHVGADLMLRHLRLFERDDIWAHMIQGIGEGITSITLSNGQGFTIHIQTELLNSYLVLRMVHPVPQNATFEIE
jgi:hypothetical protein